MSALVKKELRKPAYKGILAKNVYFASDPLQIGFGDPSSNKTVGRKAINIKPIVDLIIKQTKDPQTRIKSLQEEKDTEKQTYWSWNNKKIGEGTMSSGIFDKDSDKAKDAARNLARFLKQNKKIRIEHDPENPKKDHKDLQAYTKELMNYVFDDEMLDDLDPNNKKTSGKIANDVVTKRLKQLGVKIR